jgi:hypothetical protein
MPHRVGTYQMLRFSKVTSGKGEEGDIERLEKIGLLIRAHSADSKQRAEPVYDDKIFQEN